MNNLTFGDETFGYYETIAGGAGAGPAWDGASGVQCHMTNTRITDPEILERRYPVVLRRFSLRRGSGGAGEHAGGDGVLREIEFLSPVTVSVLTERRAFAPRNERRGRRRGTQHAGARPRRPGGEPGEQEQRRGSRGRLLRIATPGGGGFGSKPKEK